MFLNVMPTNAFPNICISDFICHNNTSKKEQNTDLTFYIQLGVAVILISLNLSISV